MCNMTSEMVCSRAPKSYIGHCDSHHFAGSDRNGSHAQQLPLLEAMPFCLSLSAVQKQAQHVLPGRCGKQQK